MPRASASAAFARTSRRRSMPSTRRPATYRSGRCPAGHRPERYVAGRRVDGIERLLDVRANAADAEARGIQEVSAERVVLFQREELPPGSKLLNLRICLVRRLRAALIEHVRPEQAVGL